MYQEQIRMWTRPGVKDVKAFLLPGQGWTEARCLPSDQDLTEKGAENYWKSFSGYIPPLTSAEMESVT